MASQLIEKYFRQSKLPHIWCPGCGHGILMHDVAQAIDNLGLDKHKVCIVSGIGCSSRAAGYMDFDTIHTTHGRAIAFATGIKLANPELHVIVITGDVVDGSPSRLEEDVAPLADLKAKYGVIFAPGNHEYYSGIQQWLPVFQRLGMHVLMNENTQIRVNGTPLAIAGVTDTAALNWGLEGPDPEKALSGLSKDITKLMLSHRPSLAPESAKAGASLQLSGHTHGGLILPVTPLIAAFNGGYVSGPYTVDGMPLYVSSGSGLWGGIPLRLFVPSEITLITLTGTGFDTN